MADLEDLGIPSIMDMSNDEAIEMLRQLRLRRRIPIKKTVSEKTIKRKQAAKATPSISKEQAAELLKLLGGSK
jgi:hypothetical protein